MDASVKDQGFFTQPLAERDPEGLQVWTSTLVRTICTASFLDNDDRFAGVQMHSLPALNELKAGVADGLTYAEVERLYPDMHKKREVNKLRFRNKDGGESYHDMMVRLEPIIFELERQREDVLVIAHRGSLRALYGYFLECSQDEVPYIDMPLDTVIELNVTAYGLTETRYNLFPEGDKMKPRKRSTKGSSQDEDRFGLSCIGATASLSDPASGIVSFAAANQQSRPG